MSSWRPAWRECASCPLEPPCDVVAIVVIQRIKREARRALWYANKRSGRPQFVRNHAPAVFAIVKPGLPSKDDGVGRGGGHAKYLSEDTLEAHLFARPNRVQQNGFAKLPSFPVGQVAQGEPTLVA